MTVVLIAMGLSALSMAFSRAVFASSDAKYLRVATALAQLKLEEFAGGSFSSIATESRAAVSGFTGFERQVTVSTPSGTDSNFKQVVVTVYWQTKGGELSTALTTYVANY
jgi:hypothetical protein